MGGPSHLPKGISSLQSFKQALCYGWCEYYYCRYGRGSTTFVHLLNPYDCWYLYWKPRLCTGANCHDWRPPGDAATSASTPNAQVFFYRQQSDRTGPSKRVYGANPSRRTYCRN